MYSYRGVFNDKTQFANFRFLFLIYFSRNELNTLHPPLENGKRNKLGVILLSA